MDVTIHDTTRYTKRGGGKAVAMSAEQDVMVDKSLPVNGVKRPEHLLSRFTGQSAMRELLLTLLQAKQTGHADGKAKKVKKSLVVPFYDVV